MTTDVDVAAREREWMEAWCRKDRETCERLLGDDFLLTSARGVLMSKADWLAGAMGPFVCDAFHWEEIQVRPLTADVAVVHARTTQRARVGTQDWSGVFLITDIWVKRKEQWQVVARHGTGPLREEADPSRELPAAG